MDATTKKLITGDLVLRKIQLLGHFGKHIFEKLNILWQRRQELLLDQKMVMAAHVTLASPSADLGRDIIVYDEE